MPKQWILGQVSGLDVDARDHVWIIQRPWSLNDDEKAKNPEAVCCTAAPPVMEFDAAGNYLQGWGGEAPGYGETVAVGVERVVEGTLRQQHVADSDMRHRQLAARPSIAGIGGSETLGDGEASRWAL